MIRQMKGWAAVGSCAVLTLTGCSFQGLNSLPLPGAVGRGPGAAVYHVEVDAGGLGAQRGHVDRDPVDCVPGVAGAVVTAAEQDPPGPLEREKRQASSAAGIDRVPRMRIAPDS